MTEIEVEYTNAKSKIAVTVTSYVTSFNCNNPKIISLAPMFSNNLHDENSVFLRGNRRFVYKSKMAAKERYEGQIQNSIYKVKATSLSLPSCIFVILFRQRLRLYKFCLFPLSEPYNPLASWWTIMNKKTKEKSESVTVPKQFKTPKFQNGMFFLN